MSVASGPALSGIEGVLAACGEEVREGLMAIERRLEEIAAASGTRLAVPAGSTISAGGKRLRPLMVLLVAWPPGDGALPGYDPRFRPGVEPLVRAAVAVELVHAASLVHDDILDGAVLRRGQSTVVAAEGREVAIATGDLMFSRAFAELAVNQRADHLRALADAASALARGELVQREDAWQVVTVARYLERCRLKTASLFEASCKLGALAGPGAAVPRASRRASELGRFGREIGMAFQILDDVLDVQGPPERTGKARGADLMDGTVNLPLILARRRDAELAALDLHSLRKPEVAELVCRRIAATGALEQARERALRLVARAKAQLPERLPPGQREVLELVADGVVERFS
jgi:geranylgeranyl pyrophosphate synthase